jgi:hypothetical protein
MTDVSQLVAGALRATADAAERTFDARRGAVELGRRVAAEDVRARRHRAALGAAAALVLGLAGAGAVLVHATATRDAAPAATQHPTPTVSAPLPLPQPRDRTVPLSERFTSPWQRYSMAYPKGWIVSTATEPWVYPNLTLAGRVDDEIASAYARAEDNSKDGGGGILRVSSQAIPPGVTAQAWLARYRTFLGGTCIPTEPMAIDGHQGWITTSTCDDHGFSVVVVTPERAYVFTGESLESRVGVLLDRALFVRIIGSVWLLPG